jgi:hypothetical protein
MAESRGTQPSRYSHAPVSGFPIDNKAEDSALNNITEVENQLALSGPSCYFMGLFHPLPS